MGGEKASALAKWRDVSKNSHQLPANRVIVLFVLFVEPGFERREIIGQCAGVRDILPGEGLHSLGPGLTGAQSQHLIQLGACRFVSVNRAAMQRALITSFFSEGAL